MAVRGPGMVCACAGTWPRMPVNAPESTVHGREWVVIGNESTVGGREWAVEGREWPYMAVNRP